MDDALEAYDGEEPGAEPGQAGQEEDGEGEQRLPAGRLRQAPREASSAARWGPSAGYSRRRGPAVGQGLRTGGGVGGGGGTGLVLVVVGCVFRHVAPRAPRSLAGCLSA